MTTSKYDHPAYKPGDVIVEAMPVIYSPRPNSLNCAGCLKPVNGTSAIEIAAAFKLLKCGKCLKFEYCSRECQQFDWENFHKHECRIYAKHGEKQKLREDFTRLALRCFILMEHRPEELTKQYDVLGGGKRCFMDLNHHTKEIENDLERKKMLDTICLLLTKLRPKFDVQQFLPILYRLVINQTLILGFDLTIVGTGVYVEKSIFGHSCAPNGGIIYNGLKMQIRAMKDISTGRAIYINYDDILQPRKNRQAQLYDQFYITCRCTRCSSKQNDDEEVMKILSLRAKIEQLIEMSKYGLGAGPFIDMCELHAELLPLLEKIFVHHHPRLTNWYMNSLKTKINANQLKSLDFEKVSKALEVTHGSDHPMYKQFVELKNFFDKGQDAAKAKSEP